MIVIIKEEKGKGNYFASPFLPTFSAAYHEVNFSFSIDLISCK